MPMLGADEVLGAVDQERLRERAIVRSATSPPRAARRSSQMTMNSSPPKRATCRPRRSVSRGAPRRRAAARPGAVAQPVVDELEAVESRNRTATVVPRRSLREREVEAVDEERPVGEPRERVVQRLVADLLLGAGSRDRVGEHVAIACRKSNSSGPNRRAAGAWTQQDRTRLARAVDRAPLRRQRAPGRGAELHALPGPGLHVSGSSTIAGCAAIVTGVRSRGSSGSSSVPVARACSPSSRAEQDRAATSSTATRSRVLVATARQGSGSRAPRARAGDRRLLVDVALEGPPRPARPSRAPSSATAARPTSSCIRLKLRPCADLVLGADEHRLDVDPRVGRVEVAAAERLHGAREVGERAAAPAGRRPAATCWAAWAIMPGSTSPTAIVSSATATKMSESTVTSTSCLVVARG